MDVKAWRVDINLRHPNGPVFTVAGRITSGQILRTGGLVLSPEAGRRVVAQAFEAFVEYDPDEHEAAHKLATEAAKAQAGTQADNEVI